MRGPAASTRRAPPSRADWVVGWAIFAALALTSCSRASGTGPIELDRDFEVVERRVFWLNSATLVFPARKLGSDRYDLYTWSPGLSEPEIYRSPGWRTSDDVLETYVCASGGEIAFADGPPRLTDVAGLYEYDGTAGPPGQEAPKTIRSFRPTVRVVGGAEEPRGLAPANAVWETYALRAGASCEERQDFDMVGRWWAFTYPDRPYLVFDRTDALEFVNARLEGDGPAIPLPLTDGASGPQCVVPTPWNGRVWAWSCALTGAPSEAMAKGGYAVWDIDPRSGQSTRTPVPMTAATRLLVAFPTRHGLYVTSDVTSPPGQDGLFEIVDGKLEPRLRGLFGEAFVSPDGCKAALSKYASSAGSSATLVVVDFCQED